MTINGNNQNKKKACMAINLAHETAHTYSMPDVYDIDGHDVANATKCAMEGFDSNTAYDFYLDVLSGNESLFCDSCRSQMIQNTSNKAILGN